MLMKIAIRYFTKSKKGNTKKLADTVSEVLGIEALTIENKLEEKVDKLFLVNAMYAFDIDKSIKNFLKENKDNIGEIFNVNSAASGSSTHKSVKKVCDKLGIAISNKEFHCVGSWININKGRPNEEELNKLKEFVIEMAKDEK